MVNTIVNTPLKVTTQILLDGAQEILGMETLQKVVERVAPGGSSPCGGAFHKLPLREAGPFLRALEEMYGQPSGRGLALRIGRAAFRYGLKCFGDRAGFLSVEYRLLPAPRRLESGLRSLACLFGEEYCSKISVSDEGTCWLWRMERDPKTAGPDCFLIAGLLQEFTTWAGGGRFYRVVEIECAEGRSEAAGSPACVFRIEKKPLD